MKNVNTAVGRAYAVTTSVACTVRTPDGVIIATCEPGKQVIFVAPCNVVQVSDDAARLTETFNSAASSASGGGVGFAYVEQKAAEASESLAAHAASTGPHLQSGERDKWNLLIPVGTILSSARASMTGYLLCNGAAVSRTSYAALFSAIGTTYGGGDGSTTFNVPDLRGRTVWGAGSWHALGDIITAGLPDIDGRFGSEGVVNSSYPPAFNIASGAFSAVDTQAITSKVVTQGDRAPTQVRLCASSYNSIYGNSSTVQPPAIAINFFIKY